MKGIFESRKSSSDFVVIALGAVFIFLAIASAIYTPNERGKIIALLLVGVFFSGIALLMILQNRNAYFIIDNDHISAQFNWKQRIDCDVSDVSFVTCTENSLTIQIANKVYSIIMLKNAWELYSYINERIPQKLESPNKKELVVELKALKKSRDKDVLLVLIPCIFELVTIAIIGIAERFTVFHGCALIAGFFGICLSIIPAVKGGKKKLEIIKLEVAIIEDTVRNTPINYENVVSAYIDPHIDDRIIVFKDPKTSEFYYVVEAYFYKADKLDQVFISEREKCIEDLNIDFSQLIRIG